MTKKINVAILEDHPSVVDGYRYRLGLAPEIAIVAVAGVGEELERLLAHTAVDVLLLDVNVPASATNSNPYPVLHAIPRLLQEYPTLAVLVISMHADRLLIRGVVEAGASGYLLKDDQSAVDNLAKIVLTVARGDIHFSQRAHHLLLRATSREVDPGLTPRQLEALSLCAAYPDELTSELARRMQVAHSTMRNLLSGAYLRLNVSTRTSAISQARQMGLITPHSPVFAANVEAE